MSFSRNQTQEQYKKPKDDSVSASAQATSEGATNLNATSPKSSERRTWAERAAKGETPEADSYKAFEPARAEARPVLELRLKKGLSYGINYAHLRGFRCAMEGKSQTLSLYADLGYIVIKGRHLEELKEKLFSHAVNWIRVFDDAKDTLPGDGEPIVVELVIQQNEEGEKESA